MRLCFCLFAYLLDPWCAFACQLLRQCFFVPIERVVMDMYGIICKTLVALQVPPYSSRVPAGRLGRAVPDGGGRERDESSHVYRLAMVVGVPAAVRHCQHVVAVSA